MVDGVCRCARKKLSDILMAPPVFTRRIAGVFKQHAEFIYLPVSKKSYWD
jgi:hypothetical protein